jgi:hypothetical protein
MRYMITASATAALVCAAMLTALGWAYSSAAQALVSVVAAMAAAVLVDPAIAIVRAAEARHRSADPRTAETSAVWILVAAWVALALLDAEDALVAWAVPL